MGFLISHLPGLRQQLMDAGTTASGAAGRVSPRRQAVEMFGVGEMVEKYYQVLTERGKPIKKSHPKGFQNP